MKTTPWRQHPIYKALAPAEFGGNVDTSELSKVGLTAAQRDQVLRTGRRAADAYRGGEFQIARRTCRDLAQALAETVPFEPTPEPVPTDPTEIANRIARY